MVIVCALYKFVRLENYASLQQPLLDLMLAHRVRGTLLLATEGINGTIAGSREGIDQVLDWLRAVPAFENLDHKESVSEELPFKADPSVLLVDTRNDYECEVGTFVGAVNPNTSSFREFPDFAKQHLDKTKHTKVAMFCTGGIRCEKSTAYLREQGFDEVYHLKGGILKYLEKVPENQSMWRGECFVFDDRVTVNHQLEPGSFDQCHGCRRPITEQDKLSDDYIAGAQCPKCCGEITDDQKERFLEREKQMRLARERGEPHMGEDAKQLLANKRLNKSRD